MPSIVEQSAAVRRGLAQSVWVTKTKYDDAESGYQRHLAKLKSAAKPKDNKDMEPNKQPNKQPATKNEANKNAAVSKSKKNKAKNQTQTTTKAQKESENCSVTKGKSSLVDEIARTRQQIKNSLQSCELSGAIQGAPEDLSALQQRLERVESDYKVLKGLFEKSSERESALVKRIEALEKGSSASVPEAKPTPVKVSESKAADDDDVDLFGSDDEDDEEREKLHQQRVEAYNEKKSKKTAIIAKSNIILDVKPWDDETDMKKMEEGVRAIHLDGLVWGAAKLVPLAYGIFKLQISCVVEDDKVSVDDLQEQIEGLEDLVQSVDIAAFNKV